MNPCAASPPATLVRRRTVYTVTGPHERTTASYDDRQDAEAEVRRRLAGDVPLAGADGTFDGGIWWATEDAPAELFDELVDEYADEPHDPLCGPADWGLDREQDFLLVEANVRGGYWLSSHPTADAAAHYHHDQEYAEDWEVTELVNHRTGERYDVIAIPMSVPVAAPPRVTT